ncbi:MAG: hypothetical protein HN975_01995 [Anaerolineae bacterium]|nr:hypothetical protein [Anaerolineae bacterium]
MADSERDVIYRLKIEESPDNPAVMRASLNKIKTFAKEADKVAEDSAKNRSDSVKKIGDAEASSAKKAAAVRDKIRSAQLAADKQAAKERDAALQQSNRLAEQSNAKFAESKAGMRDAVNTGTEGILKLGRGFATLGVLSEDSSEKMLRGLIKVTASFDILRGGIEVWRTLNMAARSYRLSLEGIALANAAAGTTSAASAGGVLGGAGLGAGIGAGVGTGLGGAAPMVGGNAAAAKAARLLRQNYKLQMYGVDTAYQNRQITQPWAAAMRNTIRADARAAGMKTGAQRFAPVGTAGVLPWAAAVGGTYLGGRGILEATARGGSHQDRKQNEWIIQNIYGKGIGRVMNAIPEWVPIKPVRVARAGARGAGAVDIFLQQERAERLGNADWATQEDVLQSRTNQMQVWQGQADLGISQRGLMGQMLGGNTLETLAEQRRGVQHQLAGAQGLLANDLSGKGEPGSQEAMQLSQMVVGFAREDLDYVRQQTAEYERQAEIRVRGAQRDYDITKSKLDTQKSFLEQERNRIRSVEERWLFMSDEERESTLLNLGEAQAAEMRGERPSDEVIRQLYDTNTRESERLRKRFTPEAVRDTEFGVGAMLLGEVARTNKIETAIEQLDIELIADVQEVKVSIADKKELVETMNGLVNDAIQKVFDAVEVANKQQQAGANRQRAAGEQ